MQLRIPGQEIRGLTLVWEKFTPSEYPVDLNRLGSKGDESERRGEEIGWQEELGVLPRARLPAHGALRHGLPQLKEGWTTANLHTKILDFRGFDSSRIFGLRGGISWKV